MTGHVPCLDTNRVKISNIGNIFPQTLLSPSEVDISTPHHFLVSTFWSQPPSGLSWLELFSIPSGQYGRIQQLTSNISHEPASIICPLCGAARTSKSLLSSHATASPRSRRPLASPVSLLWRMKGDNCVNWCYSEMFSYSVLSSHHSNHHDGRDGHNRKHMEADTPWTVHRAMATTLVMALCLQI